MRATLPGHDVVEELRPGRTALWRNRATGQLVVCKRIASRGLEQRLAALGPLAAGWGLAAIDGIPCLARPFVAGRSLAERLRARPEPWPAEDVVRLVRALATLLAPLHARGLAHGELHPGNVVEAEDGRVVLVDGLEPFRGLPDSDDPAAAAEAAYAAPEVIRGRRPTPASDVWSLGVLARRLLCGAHPFEAADPAATVARILYEAPLGIALARPDLDGAVAAAVERAAARAARRRPRSAEAFAGALGAAPAPPKSVRGDPVERRTDGPGLAARTATLLSRAARSRSSRLEGSHRSARVALVAFPALAVALLWASGDDPLSREVGERLAARDLSGAAELLDRAAARRPEDPVVEKLRGDLACARGRGAECLRRYRAALEERPSLGDDPVLRENVLGFLGHEDDRALAVRLATRLEGVDEVLLERTRSERYWARWNAVRALEARGEAERIDYADVYARDLLHGGSCATRKAAAVKLAELKDPRTLPALEQAKEDSGPFGWFCTGDSIKRAIAAVRSREAR